MQDSTPSSFALATACLALVTVISARHLSFAGRRILGKKSAYAPLTGQYEDEDGIATAESEAAYSDYLQRILFVSSASVGTLVGLASAILTVAHGHRTLAVEQWLQFATWVLILIQTGVTFTAPNSVDRFYLGVWSGLACLLLAVAIPFEDFSLWFLRKYPEPQKLHATFSAVQFGAAAVACVTNILIPRRPDVYFENKLVDRHNTTSFLGRYTFSWPASLLAFAVRNRGLTTDDLPTIGNATRAYTLLRGFEATGKSRSLWMKILRAHKWTFVAQWVLFILTAFTNFLPQIVLYYTLRLLEARDNGANNQLSLWLAAICLGFIVGLSAWLESLLFYIVFGKIIVPLYEQLSAVIFNKAIRRKDVKGAAKINEKDNTADAEDTEDNGDEEEGEGEVAKTKQSTINLLGIDGKRLADFLGYSYLFGGSAIKLMVALIFLVKLIGWKPTLCGLAVPLLLSPLNYSIGKGYSKAQDNLMKARDQKMAIVTEALQGIRQIKFSALENEWYDKIIQIRQKELKMQWRAFCFDTALISNWIFGPACLSAISLTVYALISGTLSASVAFTTISVFEAIEVTLAVIPELLSEALDAAVSARRIQEYLESAEIEDKTIPGEEISFTGATIAWPSDIMDDELFKLHDLDLAFQNGSLNVISGKTGSGKSLLLSCIIGEADILAGKVTVPRPPQPSQRYDSKANKSNWIIDNAIAYVSQIPWIENASLRDNVLFGLPFDEERYQKVLHACALEKDLEMFSDGDMTDIGANGINLSGGQKWRTSFARALYSRAGILVLDDIFSAVDAHVGRHLYEEALTGELCQGRTRILVTHHVALCLPKTQYSVLLENGRVLQAGATEELRRTGLLRDILAHDVAKQQKEEEVADQENALVVDDGGHLMKTSTNQSNRSRRLSSLSNANQDLAKIRSRASASEREVVKQREPPKKFVEEEKRETGAVKLSIYREYIEACRGFGYWTLVAVLFLSWLVVYLARSYWISIWTRQYRTESEPSSRLIYQTTLHVIHRGYDNLKTVEADHNLKYFVTIYIIISILDWVVGTVRYFSVMYASIRGSKVLFERLTTTILRTPLRFLDQTPVGRILNRFTADFNLVDSRISNDMGFMLHSGISMLTIIVAGLFVSPFMIFFALLLMGVSWYYASYYLAGAREVKRLESNAKSPIFEQFGSVLTGISTIRAFDKADVYIERMFARINTHTQAYWYMWMFNRWMGFRLNMVGAAFTLATAALIVSITGIDASLAGFALSFSLQLADSVIWVLRQYASVELDFNAVERIVEYSNLETESDGGSSPPAAWPTKGELEVDELVVGYAADLPPVLKGLTFSVRQNERIGVVGRTGAGKSSLTLALFRFLEARSGSIHIDGIDISKIKLYDLRSRLAIIPQDPVLFSGTVRSNLDPFDQYSDTELRDALARVHLISSTSATPSGSATPVATSSPSQDTSDDTTVGNTNIFKSLSSPITEGGLNLSQGQRQLLCLARAIVSRPKIMVLDEATSSVDMDTDALIQKSIREEFGRNSTLLVIAHRLSTIADFDRILVMGDGKVEEFDSPTNLMKKKTGAFKDMVESSGEKAVLEQMMFGEKKEEDR